MMPPSPPHAITQSPLYHHPLHLLCRLPAAALDSVRQTHMWNHIPNVLVGTTALMNLTPTGIW